LEACNCKQFYGLYVFSESMELVMSGWFGLGWTLDGMLLKSEPGCAWLAL